LKKMWKREDLAWVAGLTIGEGHFGAKTDHLGVVTPYFQLEQYYDHVAVKRLRNIVGFGTINEYRNHGKPFLRFGVNGHEKAQAFIAGVWDWLTPRKREQARRSLLLYNARYCDTKEKRQRYARWRKRWSPKGS